MKRLVETVAVLAFFAGASGMDSANMAVPMLLIAAGMALLTVAERMWK